MQPFQRVHIFSDLHLTALSEPLGQSFLHAMNDIKGNRDALVLAGDIFEILVGNSAYFRQKAEPFTDALSELLRRGVSIFYIEGNHDFHLSGLLPGGVILAQDSIRIPVLDASGGSKILEVVHGDLVDPADHAYLRMRRVFRSKPFRFAAERLPGSIIVGISRFLSRDHSQKSAQLPESWPEENRARLRSLFHADAEKRRALGADFVVMGHCHDLDDWGGFYWNMGYPPVHRQYLVYDSAASGGKDLMTRRYFLGN
ncbi:MAG: UDP-2,3-diacylglucosamine diphosphatase [Bdellovibrionales bacterium]|nr:UDP-2,3-diacylglucosamine diphosphatase [Bdellovibrionales bacterium]